MGKKKQENKLWSKVKHSLERHYKYICSNNHSDRKKLKQRGFINIGMGGIIPDVIGVKDIGSQYEPEIEIIAVEVKENLPNYRSRHMDQVKRAAVFAHKVFLAAPREFRPEEVELAVKERIGLFELNPNQRRLKLIVPSPSFEPSEGKVMELMKRLEFLKCSICNCYWNSNLINITSYRPMHVFSATNKTKFVRFICENCSDKLYELHSRALRSKFAEEWKFKRLSKKIEKVGLRRRELASKKDLLRVSRKTLKVQEKFQKAKKDIRTSVNKKFKGLKKKIEKVRKRLKSI